MRIVIADPFRMANDLLTCVLGAVYDLGELSGAQIPRGGDPAVIREWVDSGGFADGGLLLLHQRFSLELAETLVAMRAHIVTLVREPYDAFVDTYQLAQREGRGSRSRTGRSSIMTGKPLDHPDVLGFLAYEFRSNLEKANDWVQSGRTIVVRYDDLQNHPSSVLIGLTRQIGPVDPERLNRGIERCQAKRLRRATRRDPDISVTNEGAKLTDAHLHLFKDLHAGLILGLGYSIREPQNPRTVPVTDAPSIGEERSSEAIVPPAMHRQFRYARSGGSDFFVQIGDAVVQRFVEYAGLKSDERVLDVGSGVGRIALALTKYLSSDARYEGFDVDPEGIAWSQENITPRFPNFHFQVADIYTKNYNPGGQYRASEYRFPFDDGSFSFCFLTSIFTHLLPADLEHYLDEIARVLEPGGRCYITMMLLNDVSLDDIANDRGSRSFRYNKGAYRLQNNEIPERAIAYEEEYTRRAFAQSGLTIVEPIYFRGWSRTKQPSQNNQDVIVATK